MTRLLWRSSGRYLLRHPWQSGLSMLGIALGVAVVVSVDLANASASRAFTLSTASITGRTTHQIIGGPAGVPEDLYRKLRVDLNVRSVAPVVEGDVAAPDYPGRTFHLLGIDPFAERPFRPYLSGAQSRDRTDVSTLLTQPATGLLSSETATKLGLKVGETLTILIGTSRHPITLIGVLEPGDEMSRRALESLLVTDVATAQELLNAIGYLSRIDLIAPEGLAGESLLQRVQTVLPDGVQVIRASSRSQALAQMTRAFNFNLTALSLLALIVGMFLIYNAVTFSVVQRRALIGMVRALGVTRREIFQLVLGEALLTGLIGTTVGIVLGIIVGRGLVNLVTQTINDLYFVLSVRELTVEPFSLLKGAALGLGATLVAALVPAFEATTAPPRAVMSRSIIESRLRRIVPRAALGGVLFLVLGGGVLLLPSRSLVLSYGAFLAIILGCALLTPAITIGLMKLIRPLMSGLFGVLGNMSARDVVAALSRTAVAIASLMIAIATTVGVGIMIGSFRHTVVRWLETSLQADIYIAPPSLVARRNEAALDPTLIERLSSAPGIASVNTSRGIMLESPAGLTQVIALKLDPRSYSAFRFKQGDPERVWPAFQDDDAVIVSEPYAYRHDLRIGSAIRLRTDRGDREFRVAGIHYDYGSDLGVVTMSRRTYERYWDDRRVTSLGVYVTPGTNVDALVESLRRIAGEQEVRIRPNRMIRDASLKVFDRTFAITAILRLLTIGVAFIGILSALMAIQLERARELAVLRANGLTPRQVWGLITLKTGLMGLVAGLLALPVGIVLAVLLVFVIDRRSFGWTMELTIAPDILMQALLLAVAAAILAGVYPALKMARTSPALALRGE